MIQNFHLLINNFLEFSLLSFSGTKSIRQGKQEQVEENLQEVLPNRNLIAKFLSCRRNSTLLTNSNKGENTNSESTFTINKLIGNDKIKKNENDGDGNNKHLLQFQNEKFLEDESNNLSVLSSSIDLKCEKNTNIINNDDTFNDKYSEKNNFDNPNLDEIFLIRNPMIRLQSDASVALKTKTNQSNKEESLKILPYYENNFNYFRPFVLFKDFVFEPKTKFKDLNIRNEILTNLMNCGRFENLSPLQQWAIPAMSFQQNVLILGSSKTGKTLGYVISVIDVVKKKCAEEESFGNGPIAVIICSSSRVCEFVYSIFNALLGKFNKNPSTNNFNISIVMAYGGGNEMDVKLTNGCHILISTSYYIVRLLEYSIVTNFERLKCLVLDEIDIISEKPFKQNVQLILEKAKQSTQNRYCQKIFCGEKWTENVEILAKNYLENYFLVIGSYAEAAIYSKLRPSIYLVKAQHKPEFVMDKIRDELKKILILCESTDEALDVHNYLKNKNINSSVAHEKMLSCQIRDICHSWKICDGQFVIVATDDVVNELKINDVDMLIHYSLTVSKKVTTSDIIILDENNGRQIPQIVDFVVRLNGNVPDVIREKCKEIERKLEVSKEARICEKLLTLGKCINMKSCCKRHALVNDIDSSSQLPSSGWINFSVLKVHNPTNICAIKSFVLNKEVFYRAEIRDYIKVNKHNQPLIVNVRLLDEGDYVQLTAKELLEIPYEIAKIPSTAIEVKIVGIQPLGYDQTWSKFATNYAKGLLTKNYEKDLSWRGKIIIAMKDTLFLDCVLLTRALHNVKTNSVDLIYQENLIQNGYAVKNAEHFSRLKKLCIEGGISVFTPNENKNDLLSKEKFDCCEPDWAFLSENVEKVCFLSGHDASTFFLRLEKFSKLLEDLEKACEKEAGEKNKKNLDKNDLSPGMFCLAKFNNERWVRGRIDSKENDFYNIYLIDHGKFSIVNKFDVTTISCHLIRQLPCQAIEFNFIGVKIHENNNLTEISREMDKFFDNENNFIYCYGIEKNLKSKITGGKKYGCNLLNGINGKSLNKYLIDIKMGSMVECEKEFLINIESKILKGKDDEKNFFENEEEEEKNKESENLTSDYSTCENESNSFSSSFLSDELLFENENEIQFLKEFATNVLDIPMEKLADESLKTNENGKEENMDSKESQTEKIILESRTKKPEVMIRDKILTPQIRWSQNSFSINIKILINNIEKYKCDCSVTNFLFRCEVDGKYYAVDIKFNGVVNPQTTKITLKTFYANINIRKLNSMLWSRLTRDDGKNHFVLRDSEVEEKKDDIISLAIESAKKNIESGILKEGIRLKTIVSYTDSDSSDFDDGFMDSGDEFNV
ncbi:DEAD box ATP-dependent RNA helicase, putative [Pediculus humanus corporis]|uniref:RNA helicase n=1 Tax=Pediculus humanus subsp. corporis TaxID=121224 RepID=E0VCM0_PEDHC|nr:DEAD box ATP-dependent RNA helicase, putative [Pediculus humanus corporis]EEB11126.1 DEAD box ATP-dependent RNA helicase, putative [Pediculus humanus corporis]